MKVTGNPKVSIILPTYNGSKYVRASIESCLKQTYKNFELIIVDDCSTDETPQVIQSYKDGRIKYVRNAQNQRLPRSLNIGFKQATGEYLTWTSDDNQFLPTAIEEMLSFLQANPDADFVYTDLYILDFETGQTLIRQLPSKMEIGKLNRIGACYLYTRKVYESIGDYNPDYELVEDYDFWIRISRKFKMAHLPKALYIYGDHSNSLTSKKIASVRLFDKLLKFRHGFISLRELYQGMGEYLQDAKGISSRFTEFLIGWFHVVKKIARLSAADSIHFIFASVIFSAKVFINFLSAGVLYFPRKIFTAYRIKKTCNNLKSSPDKKNILCFIPAMVVGGSEKVVVSMIQGFDNADYAFHLMTIKKEKNKWCEAFCSHFQNSILLDKMDKDIYFRYVCAVVERLNIDAILVSNASSAYYFLPKLKARFPHLKVMDILHLEDSVGAKKEFSTAVPYIDTRVCISEFLKGYMIEKYNSFPIEANYKNRLKVIYNGTEMLENGHYLKKGQFKARYKIPENTKIISFIHRFSSEKNPLLFIDIAHELIKKTPANTFKFVMAGDGKRFEEVKQKIEDLGLQDNFILPGMLDDVSELLCDTFLLLIVSGKEGIPLIMLEALALQVPVISTNVGGIKEVLKDGVNGYLVDFNEELVKQVTLKVLNLLQGNGDYRTLSQRTRESILPEFSLETMGARYKEVFEELLK